MLIVVVKRISRDEEPTITPKLPLTFRHACVPTSQIDVEASFSGKVTVAFAPG